MPGSTMIKGTASLPTTFSPAATAGTPAPPVKADLVRKANLELSDASAVRGVKKATLLTHWLKDYSYSSPEQASADTLVELLEAFERVNAREG